MALLIGYTVIVGLVASGLAGSLWSVATGAAPSLALFEQRDWRLPINALAVTLYAPILALRWAWMLAPQHLLISVLLAAASCVWCFLQGVFILTRLLGTH
ncbi:MAG: hypothetical protein AB7F76_03795 [Parvibaculaceae bacterium]